MALFLRAHSNRACSVSTRPAWNSRSPNFSAEAAPPAFRGHLPEPHRVDRRQVSTDDLPALAAVVTGPERAGGRAHDEPFAAFIHLKAMAVDQVIGVALRQALAEHLPG